MLDCDRSHHSIGNEASSHVVVIEKIGEDLPMASIRRWYPGGRRVQPVRNVLPGLTGCQWPVQSSRISDDADECPVRHPRDADSLGTVERCDYPVACGVMKWAVFVNRIEQD